MIRLMLAPAALFAVFSVGVVACQGEPAATAPRPLDARPVRRAATPPADAPFASDVPFDLAGTWKGDAGTLTLRDGGSGRWDLRICRYDGVSPDPATRPQRCRRLAGRGQVSAIDAAGRADSHHLTFTPARKGDRASGGTFAAYLSHDGSLHLGAGAVALLDRDRKGEITLGRMLDLAVGPSCEIGNEELETHTATSCTFVSRGGLQLLTFAAPLDADHPRVVPQSLVYLPEERLLVSPDLVWGTLRRQ